MFYYYYSQSRLLNRAIIFDELKKSNKRMAILKNPNFINFAVLGSDRTVQLFSQLFNIIVIAKYLHTAQFGVYMYAISLYGIVLSVTHFGLEKVLVVEYSHTTKISQRQNIFLNGVLIKFVSCILTFSFLEIGVHFFSHFVSKDTLNVLLKLSIATFFTSWMLIDTYNQYEGKFKNTVYARAIATIFFLIIKVYIIYHDLGFDLLVYGFIGEQVLCLILAIVFSKNFISFTKQINISLFTIDIKIIKSGWIVLFSALSILIYFKAAQGMVENELGYKFLGVYSLVISLIEIPIAISSIMSTILTPKLTVLLKNNRDDIHSYSRLLFFFFIMGIICSICILVVGLVVSNYLGADYNGFYNMLLKSIISLPIIFIGYFFNTFLLCSKKFNQYFILTFLGAIFTIIFLFFMHGNVTINNAVYLYVFSQTIASLIVPLIFQSELRKIFFKSIGLFSNIVNVEEWKFFFRKLSKTNIVSE